MSPADVARLVIVPGSRLSLLDPRDDEALAIITGTFLLLLWQREDNILSVEDIYTPNKVQEAIRVMGADDPAHPSVAYIRNRVQDRYLGGKLQAIKAPIHFDYAAFRCKECLSNVLIFLIQSML